MTLYKQRHCPAGYNRCIQAGSYDAVIAHVLPIPYAGQAFGDLGKKETASVKALAVYDEPVSEARRGYLNSVTLPSSRSYLAATILIFF